MTRRGWWILALIAAPIAGCGGGSGPEAGAGGEETAAALEEGSRGGAGLATEYAGTLDVNLDRMNETESGLHWQTLEKGEGETAESGDTVLVHYTGWLSEGTRFDSSRDRGEPFRFLLGAGRVIPGWDEGVTGMKEGETRRLVIPPALGYGERGAGDVIPPDATLVFEVELVEVVERARRGTRR